MSYELFWFGDPGIVKAYDKAHELRNQQRNQEMWFQGLYNYRAFAAVASNLAHSMSGKGGKLEGYVEEPFPITEAEQKERLERKKKRTLDWVEANQ